MSKQEESACKVEQILAGIEQKGIQADPFFMRTSDGHEIDLILESGGSLLAVEIKLTSSPDLSDMARLSMLSDQIGATAGILVSQTAESWRDGRRIACNLPWLLDHIEDL